MAIVKMSKFNLIAFESQKSKLLKNLQKFREVSFIDIDLEENMNTDEEKIVKKVVMEWKMQYPLLENIMCLKRD